MELKDLEDIVENMILQLSYPGLDSRSLNISLPMSANEAPVKLFIQALNSQNVNVKLSALRWLYSRPGAAKNHLSKIGLLLEDNDSWIRKEAIKTIEITKVFEPDLISKITLLLKDNDQIVRIEAAKCLGNLLKEMPKTASNTKSKNTVDLIALKESAIKGLQEASEDPTQEVRRKAIKSLRKLGAFTVS